MATNNKDFKVKNGLIVEGSSATVNGNDVLTSGSSVNDLADVNVTSPSSGQVLKWNGSAWINDIDNTGSGGGGGGINNVVEDTTPQLGGDLDAQSYDITNVNSVGFDTTPSGVPTTVGTMSWDPDNETAQIQLDGVMLQVGQEHIVRVKNNSGSVAIPDRTLVMFAGATGDTVKATPAITSNVDTYPSDYIIGITIEEIPADGFGFVTQFGFINQVDTSSWTVGTLLYGDPATPGGFVSTRPAAPAWQTPIAAVTKQSATAGRIFVRAIPGIKLANVEGVEITSPADNSVLAYDTSSGTWIDQTASEAGLATASHIHDDRYYTESETDTLLSAKANTSDVPELARDAIGSALVAGTNVTITPDDAADTITISSIDTNTITRLQGTGGSLVSGDVTIQGSGNISTSQSGNTITVNAVNVPKITTTYTQTTPPSTPTAGDLWFQPETGTLFVYYVDSDSTSQWVEIKPQYAAPTGSFTGDISATGTATVGALVNNGTSTLNGAVTNAGPLTVAAGLSTAGNAPLKFQTGTLLATPEQGAVEFDGSNFFVTNNPGNTSTGAGRGIVLAPQMVFLQNTSAAATTTNAAFFESSNDVLSRLEPASLYMFKMLLYPEVTAWTTGGTIQLTLLFSNTPAEIKYNFKTYSATTTGTTLNQLGVKTATTNQLITATTTAVASYVTEIEGYFKTHATNISTLTPQFRISGGTQTVVMNVGSTMQLQRIGSSTSSLIAGNWA